ncbi:frequency clock protein [Microdochium trichocladiopsis]|uniref:Frequency clock protein n=1 Tax=Microdochium trichocladiopsis TaxID=1682393 RepID=A0A9P8Y3Y7_9PEZI|nr:frequency clock protein [Microdochium trichocladiopsis]KAH7028954.1 frequency clock protein [Microdochium trichocladiopsis]
MQRSDPSASETPPASKPVGSSTHGSTTTMSHLPHAAASPGPNVPPQSSVTYHRNPRRTSPENSVTLRHHRLAQEASRLHQQGSRRPPIPPVIPAVKVSQPKSPRRGSSGESNATGLSDPRKWFDGANTNRSGVVDTSAMDVDPPFFQRETDSSNEDLSNGRLVPSQSPAYRFVQNRPNTLRAGFTQSSSADDYRSVIDDLTIENKRLREELKRYKQIGPDALRREKLFEVKVHGLPSQKRRELEATLRDFTQSLDGSSIGTPKRSKKSSGKSKHVSSGVSKHPSSSSGSNTRPVDSAYASMSGPSSTGLSGAKMDSGPGALRRSNQKIENYLRDIPEGLWPRANVLTEKDKKKLVVRRLEQLFTGQMARPEEQGNRVMIPPINEDVEMTNSVPSLEELDPGLQQQQRQQQQQQQQQRQPQEPNEPSREAQIRPHKAHTKDGNSRDESSATHSRSREDLTESRDTGNGSGSGSGSGRHSGGNSNSPQDETASEQRPTRPRDLDPDRRQVPSENMEYIRHLGIKAPESQTRYSSHDVSPDADGWVYLNLLCNLAQLHIFNVAPDFVRSAVSEKSTKFQLSPDGRKIRWRGGDEGTRFTSEGSGSASQRTQSSDDTDGSNNEAAQHKASKAGPSTKGDVTQLKTSNFRPQTTDSDPSDSFHYKPLFVHHNTSSSEEPQSNGDESGSSADPQEDSNAGGYSRWGQSGGVSGAQSQRKRRRDGAIIYYQGAPFCTDLSGDYGAVSPDTYGATTSSGLRRARGSTTMSDRPLISRSPSGSSLPFRPLSEGTPGYASMAMDSASDVPDLTGGETDSDTSCEANLEWSQDDQPQRLHKIALEASGLSGVYPEDHFLLAVSTRRMKDVAETDDLQSEDDSEGEHDRKRARLRKRDTPDSVTQRLASMTTSSPIPVLTATFGMGRIEIEYIGTKYHKLSPVPLPPPSFYFPAADDSDDDMDTETTSELISRRVTEAAYPEDGELSGNDEEDEDSVAEADYDASGSISPDDVEMMPTVTELGMPDPSRIRTGPALSGSSVATAGGAVSGASSLEEL